MNLYLRTLSLLVPSDRRQEWFQEWHAELWHLRSEQTSPRDIFSFLQGATPDAWALHRQNRTVDAAQPGVAQTRVAPSRDGRRVLLRFTAALLAAIVLALLTPGSRWLLLAHSFRPAGEIVFLEDTVRPRTSYAEYLDWSSRPNSPFEQLAFYSTARNTVHTGSAGAFHETVAHATPNLLHLLGLATSSSPGPSVYLTSASAMRLGHPAFVLIANRRLPVAGTVPETTLALPGNPSLFLLDTRMPAGMHGHVLAHAQDGGPDLRFGLILLHPGRSSSQLSCVPIATFVKTPLSAFLFALFLALLALPATQPLSRQDSPFDRHHLPLHRRFLPSGFLVAQMVCLLCTVFFASLAFSTMIPVDQPSNTSMFQAVIAFTFLLPGLRLTLRDHRHRCPSCMGRLEHPARVGQPSAAFLNWYGTELLCARGHGLLHIPELPTTWFPTARWTPLDSSWSALFR